MFDKEVRYEKVVSFYQSLPGYLIEEIIDKLPANRDFRRKLSKIKAPSKKIEMLMSSKYRRMFADTAYNITKDNVTLDLATSSYDDIIAAITNDNMLYVAIFFFRWCYEDSGDGISNDKIYFDTFVDSKLFDCILNRKAASEDSITNDIEEAESSNVIVNPESDISNDNGSLDFVTYEEVKTMKLLGRIERRTTYYNFFPQYENIDGRFEEIPSAVLQEDYPSIGGINLSYTYSGISAQFLGDISTDSYDDEDVNNAYVIEIEADDLEENNNETYKIKLDLQKLVSEGKNLSSVIQCADNYGIYKVVTSEAYPIADKTFINSNVNLFERNIREGEMVVLEYDGSYYGPFKACYRTIDNKFYVKTGASENNYLVPFYTAEDADIITLEKQAYDKDPQYTSFIQTNGEKPHTKDVITDEILLEKISDDISLDLAMKNPEEFSHLCGNSPFLAKLPQDIITSRIERLLAIIKDVDRYKETKHSVFESLLKLYRDEPSEVSDVMVKDSDTFKELQARYSEARRKSEDAEKQIQDLKRDLDDLKAQLKMSENSLGTAMSEEAEAQYKADIKQLREELDKAKAVIDLEKSIDSLKEDQEKLKHNNEFLVGQAKEYEEKVASARAAVSKAIETGASDMASLAFDPFIASEMMKKAASWDSKTEDEEYQKLQNELSSVTPSVLSGKDLVDYIVCYVQQHRKYDRNDIINIYISIAQNFITVFSGEPGTGKTSMCNIVAETLGLLNFGERINRFVSVSVERGWSSKRDLIGYFNPLTRKYDKSNSKIYDALRILDVERTESGYPFVIMLDEANLSPIEYYWADFMRLTDRTSKNDMYINIGDERELFVPETLKFVATINTDQTTETLSPRLIDRACIIKLPKAEPKPIGSDASKANEIITWSSFINTFSKTSELHPITQKAMKEIYKLFVDYGMSVSPRIQLGIEKYVMAAQEIMEDEPDALAREKALDFAIVQKLLPKINGYYSLYERFFDALKQLCKEYNLNMTEEAISKIVEAQERNMGYCQYLI